MSETRMVFNESESVARVRTINAALAEQLRQLAADRPDECFLDPKDPRFYVVPKAWITVNPPEKEAAHG